MPIPTLTTLSPSPDFTEVQQKLNKTIQELNNLLLNLDSLNVVSITANSTTITSDLSGGAYIQLDGNGLVVNNGAYNTFTVDINGNVVMTSATVQSQSAYPKVVMDPTGDLFGAYTSATNAILIGAFNGGTSAPYLEFLNGSLDVTMDLTGGVFTVGGNSDAELVFPSGDLDLRGADNYLFPINLNHVESWNRIYADSQTESLQDALDDKANKGNLTSSGGGASLNGGIAPGTVLMVSGGGTVTWTGINVPSHSHTQT